MQETTDINNSNSLREAIEFFKEFKKVIVIGTISFTLFSYIYSLTLTPVYVSELVMIPAGQDSGAGSSLGGLEGLARITGITTQLQGEEETALAILKTRSFLQTYVEDENLLPVIFPDQWDSNKKRWKGQPPDIMSAISKLKSSIFIFKKNRIHTLLFEWDDPDLASKFANDLIARVNDYIRNESTKESEKNIFFLEQQLEETNFVNIKSVMYRIVEDQIQKIMLANSREEYAFKVIDPAIPPESPSRPNHFLAIVIGFILGFSFSLVGIFSRNLLLKSR